MTVIYDTDPGVDDMLGLLLLLSVPRAQEELKLISLTFGNCSLQATVRNTLSLFKVIDDENKWRKQNGEKSVTDQRPMIALGSSGPLAQPAGVNAEDVHGADGLAGIHKSNPEFDAPQEWEDYFTDGVSSEKQEELPFVVENKKPSWEAILEVLRSEPDGTVTIVAVGPLTNVARAAQSDPKAFSRVKELLVMGGSLRVPGNVTPTAEFNVYADPDAAAYVYSLTSEHPEDTALVKDVKRLPSTSPLTLKLFPLDTTDKHLLYLKDVHDVIGNASKSHPDSVLLRWIYTWLSKAFANYGQLIGVGPDIARMSLHDPLTAAYILNLSEQPGKWVEEVLDVRVETSGSWSAGTTIGDFRGRARKPDNAHDFQKWLTTGRGNNVTVIKEAPFDLRFDIYLLNLIVKKLGPTH